MRHSMLWLLALPLLAIASGGTNERTAKVDSSKTIWKSSELNLGLPVYDVFGGPQLLLTKNGSILSIIEGRQCGEGPMGCEDNDGRHDIVAKRSDDGGMTFGDVVLVHTESTGNKSVVIGNPAAVLEESTGRIFVFMCRNNTFVLLTHSDTNGATWSTPIDLTSTLKRPDWGWYATTYSGIQLKRQPLSSDKNGRLIICCDHEDHYNFANDAKFIHSHIIYSDDKGSTWQIGGVADEYTSECAVAELDNGTVVMNIRSYVGRKRNHRAIAWSTDGGESFSPSFLVPTLPDPIVEGSMTTDATGKMLVFTHPASVYPQRDHMTAYSSVDGGASWLPAVQLDTGYTPYSSIILLQNGSFAVQYDFGRTHYHRCNAGADKNDCGEMFVVISFDASATNSSSLQFI